jgi:hypothetical protein
MRAFSPISFEKRYVPAKRETRTETHLFVFLLTLFLLHRSMWKIAKRFQLIHLHNSHRSLSSTRMISWTRMKCLHGIRRRPNRRPFRRDTPHRPLLAFTIASFLSATICPSWWYKIAARDSGKRRGRKVSWPRRKDRRSCPRTKRTGSGP